jgi:hypothetical protein
MFQGSATQQPEVRNTPSASYQQGITDKISDPVFRSFLKPHGRSVDRTPPAKQGLLVVRDPGPDDGGPNLEALPQGMQPHAILPADRESAAGPDRDAADAQINDVHELVVIEPAGQAFDRHFEALMLSLIVDHVLPPKSMPH